MLCCCLCRVKACTCLVLSYTATNRISRVLQAGRMDLTQVEGLADLLSAETNAQRLQALSAAGGMARQRYEAWRGILLRCLAHVEAVIDFGEEEDIAEDVAKGVVKQARELRKELERHLNSASDGELVRIFLLLLLP